MELNITNSNSNTPLSEEEKEGLLIPTIINHAQLDEYEQANIEDALQWIVLKSFSIEKILTETFIKQIHKRMFGTVWKWAGQFRQSEKNLGIPWIYISIRLKNLLDDVNYWIEHKTYEPDEIAIRFKHVLVSIHCFPNGNGRHSRIMADIIIEKIFNLPVFTWGAGDLIRLGDVRTSYIQALKAADQGDYSLLLIFARS